MNTSGTSVRHINSETCMTTCYSQIPSGDCQEEAGFETGERRDGEDFGRVYCANGGR
ncbi:hypothetical protein KS35_004113 [Salmonella enterica subsp. enterica]|nr:hypothetical protein [Salmonella enterica subsp. enterica]